MLRLFVVFDVEDDVLLWEDELPAELELVGVGFGKDEDDEDADGAGAGAGSGGSMYGAGAGGSLSEGDTSWKASRSRTRSPKSFETCLRERISWSRSARASERVLASSCS